MGCHPCTFQLWLHSISYEFFPLQEPLLLQLLPPKTSSLIQNSSGSVLSSPSPILSISLKCIIMFQNCQLAYIIIIYIPHIRPSYDLLWHHMPIFITSFMTLWAMTPCCSGWNADWEAVSDVLSPAPPSKLDIKWENSRYVQPGDRIPVTVMGDRPTQLRWRAERGALYTVMLLDAGLWLIMAVHEINKTQYFSNYL